MQLSEMQAYIFNRLGLSTTQDATLLTDVTTQLNENVREIVAKYDLKTTSAALTLTASQATVSLPADWTHTLTIRTPSRMVEPLTPREFDEYLLSSPSANGPAFYTLRSNALIEVSPTPDAAAVTAGATIRYGQVATLLALATDTPSDIPVIYHRLPCERTIASIAEEEGEPAIAQLAEARAERLEDRLRLFLGDREGVGDPNVPLLHYRR